MNRKASLAVLALSALVAFAAVTGCSKKSGSSLATAPGTPSATGYGFVRLQITDAPAMYDHINLDVQEVWVHRLNDGTRGDTLGDCDSSRDDDGHDRLGANAAEHHRHGRHGRREHGDHGTWIQLSNTPGVIDLLALQDGVFATLGTDSVPAGSYNQIRLLLGADNSIVVDTVTYPLVVPSLCRTGYILVGRFDVPAEGGVDVGIDFDAARSIHQFNGNYVLIPVVRIVPLTDTGNIAGIVRPIRARSWVFAIQGADTVTSTRTRAGRFTLSLLPAGDYTVAIAPTAGFQDTSLSGVSVAIHRTTDVGVIQLSPAADSTAEYLGAASIGQPRY